MCANGLPDKNMAITTQLTIENQWNGMSLIARYLFQQSHCTRT